MGNSANCPRNSSLTFSWSTILFFLAALFLFPAPLLLLLFSLNTLSLLAVIVYLKISAVKAAHLVTPQVSICVQAHSLRW
jgi:hypothetical protein